MNQRSKAHIQVSAAEGIPPAECELASSPRAITPREDIVTVECAKSFTCRVATVDERMREGSPTSVYTSPVCKINIVEHDPCFRVAPLFRSCSKTPACETTFDADHNSTFRTQIRTIFGSDISTAIVVRT